MTQSFEIDDTLFAKLTASARSTVSPYTDDVAALVPGKARMVDIPEGKTGRSVVNNLLKAADAAKVKIQVVQRPNATEDTIGSDGKPVKHPHGVVLFKLVTPPVATATVPATTDAPAPTV